MFAIYLLESKTGLLRKYQIEKTKLFLTTASSFSQIPNQSIDIQRELKLWQSKMSAIKATIKQFTIY
ncbi:hypothetical protein BpHYR1_023800 [Brachionus plicatilis]|uniref:Uncharacterized protein n=1 Tax=Brachionus plicatilis TaxID=10195 RepID=A0A3M7QJ51_BRAPC|nr:hypothetical protein BpHYR1_023800 [Brachionus plicatilis]